MITRKFSLVIECLVFTPQASCICIMLQVALLLNYSFSDHLFINKVVAGVFIGFNAVGLLLHRFHR